MSDWIDVDDEYPPDDERVLTYSPVYGASKHEDKSMLFRMMTGCFVRLCVDVKYWKRPDIPKHDEGIKNENNLQE